MNDYQEVQGNIDLIVKEVEQKYQTDLRKRLFNFAVRTMKFLLTIPPRKEYDVFRYQISKAATSIGANYEESQASSFREFTQKVRIALREARESNYFLRIVDELEIGNIDERRFLVNESKELTLILGSIVSKCDQKKDQRSKSNEKR